MDDEEDAQLTLEETVQDSGPELKEEREGYDESEREEGAVGKESARSRSETQESSDGEVNTQNEASEIKQDTHEIPKDESSAQETPNSHNQENLRDSNDRTDNIPSEQLENLSEIEDEKSKIRYIEKHTLNEVIRDLDEPESIDVEKISAKIEDLIRNSPDKEVRIRVGALSQADISSEQASKIEDLLQNQGQEIRENLRERFAAEKNDDIRVGLVQEKLFIWTPDTNPNDMIYGWRTQYFYMNIQDISAIVEETGRRLELGKDQNQNLTNLDDLMQQFVTESKYNQINIKDTNSRLTGEVLRFCQDAIGAETKDVEGKIQRVAGANGHGGIENPKFPTGKDLEEHRARLIGTVVSDCYVRPDGIVELTEENPERIERFKEETLRKFGDFTKEARYIEEEHYYRLKIPSPYGRALNEWGIPSGDRTILNYGLPKETENWSKESMIAYLQDMISQEGHITEGKIRWERSNALNAGPKADNYDLRSQLNQREIDLLLDKGLHYPGDYDGEKTLRWNTIKDLTQHEDPRIAETAKEFCNVIDENRNRLMDDEEKIVNKLGIHLEVNPEEVAIYRSGRISVKWEARTNDTKSMIRWGIICSPNHPEKGVALNKWLAQRKDEEVQEVIEALRDEGFNVSDNWRETINEEE
jgi:hypothetical protein